MKRVLATSAVLAVALWVPASDAQAPSKAATCLIFDLDGNGLKLTSRADGVEFDADADGQTERVGWTATGAADALLALDTDGSGRIDTGSELVGNMFRNPMVKGAASGITVISLLQGAVLTPDNRLSLPAGDSTLEPSDEVFSRGRDDSQSA